MHAAIVISVRCARQGWLTGGCDGPKLSADAGLQRGLLLTAESESVSAQHSLLRMHHILKAFRDTVAQQQSQTATKSEANITLLFSKEPNQLLTELASDDPMQKTCTQLTPYAGFSIGTASAAGSVL